MVIRSPDVPRELPAVAELLSEYATTPEVQLSAAQVLGEVAEWPGPFAPPGGFWVAESRGDLVGCIGLRPHGPATGELGRLYVRPLFRGRGVGRLLVEQALAAAADAGYRRVVLDTVPALAASLRLYSSLGFVPIEPWAGLATGTICLGRMVVPAQPGGAPARRGTTAFTYPGIQKLGQTADRTRADETGQS